MFSEIELKISARLEKGGWRRDVAGADYDTAVRGLSKALSTERLGVIVSGEYGVGKTSMFSAILTRATKINCVLQESVQIYDREAYPDIVDLAMDGNVFIDDLGAENIVNVYGVRKDIVGDFICRFHLLGKGRLFVTTNLRGEEIMNRYGGRVFSRLKDLCVPIRFVGKDKRAWTL